MTTFLLLLVACWLGAATLLAWTARASKMSFLGWLFIGVFFPAILLALLAEYGRERLHALLIFNPKLVQAHAGLTQTAQPHTALRS